MVDFVLCADDYAISDGVSRSILALLEAGRISATGAMTNRPGWPIWARELAPHAASADLGLHLNLTCGTPLAPMPLLAPSGELPPLARVMRAALANASVRAEIKAEIACQLDAYEAAIGAPPAFLDGHQHVHVLPGVRALVLAELTRRGLAGRLYLRDSADNVAAIRRRGVAVRKALVIKALASGFGQAARAAGFATNRGFAGVSPFDPRRDMAADFRRCLISPGPCHLVMCHPGFVDDELRRLDPVVATRPLEHDALMRGPFSDGARIRRFSEMP